MSVGERTSKIRMLRETRRVKMRVWGGEKGIMATELPVAVGDT